MPTICGYDLYRQWNPLLWSNQYNKQCVLRLCVCAIPFTESVSFFQRMKYYLQLCDTFEIQFITHNAAVGLISLPAYIARPSLHRPLLPSAKKIKKIYGNSILTTTHRSSSSSTLRGQERETTHRLAMIVLAACGKRKCERDMQKGPAKRTRQWHTHTQHT